MKPLNNWLEEYGESHQNKTNVLIHKICVPLIFISIYFILFSLPFPFEKTMYANWANVAYILTLIFYFRLSVKIGFGFLAIGFFLAFISFLAWVFWFYLSERAMLRYSLIIFILAWIGQFIGHKIEGKKPSFLKDLQFLLIGPIWVVFPRRKPKLIP
jgi:uncharacterized membrane protein YGL010W